MILGISWFLCGIVTAGIAFADFDTEFPENKKASLKFALKFGLLLGPFGLIAALFESSFCKHGWFIRGRKK